MKIKRSVGERIFECCNIVFMLIIIVVMAYPLLYVIFASLSDANKFIAHEGGLLAPIGFTFKAYEMMSKNSMILRGYLNTLFIVVVGTTVNVILTSLGAYFLSTKGLTLKKTNCGPYYCDNVFFGRHHPDVF